MTPRRRRMMLVGLIVLGVGAAVSFALTAFQDNLLYFYSPSDVVAGKAPTDRVFRVGGIIELVCGLAIDDDVVSALPDVVDDEIHLLVAAGPVDESDLHPCGRECRDGRPLRRLHPAAGFHLQDRQRWRVELSLEPLFGSRAGDDLLRRYEIADRYYGDREQEPWVAEVLARHGVDDIVALQAALLHDTIEDTETAPAELEERFGPEVLSVVLEVSDALVARLRGGQHCLLMVDEAQNLSVEALEELRMLSNFQFNNTPLVQSFLLGQPQLRRILGRPDLSQLRQRVIASYHLGPMSEGETANYVLHRLQLAGWKFNPSIDPGAMLQIHHHSGGIPRRINTLCTRLLLFGALEELHNIDAAAVDMVQEDLDAEFRQVVEEEPVPYWN